MSSGLAVQTYKNSEERGDVTAVHLNAEPSPAGDGSSRQNSEKTTTTVRPSARLFNKSPAFPMALTQSVCTKDEKGSARFSVFYLFFFTSVMNYLMSNHLR